MSNVTTYIGVKMITLKDLLKMLVKRIWVIVVAMAICAGLIYFIANSIKTPVYMSSSNIQVRPSDILDENGNPKPVNPSMTTNNYISIEIDDAISNVFQGEKFYSEMLNILNEKYPEEGKGLSTKSLRAAVSYSHGETSRYFRIKATHSNNKVAYAIADVISENINWYMKNIISTNNSLEYELNEPAVLSTTPVPNNGTLYIIIGLLIGIIVAAVGIVIYEIYYPIIDSKEKLKRTTPAPILSEIKVIDKNEKNIMSMAKELFQNNKSVEVNEDEK